MRNNQEVPAFKLDIEVPPLNDEEFKHANEAHNDTSFLKFRKVDRHFADPLFQNQVYSLHSFAPAKGATPDENGIYGVMKIRGTFQTPQEAAQRSRYLIKNIDSYNPIITGYVGRPMPLVADHRKFCEDNDEVDMNKKTEDVVNEDLREKRQEDKKVIKEIKEKEKKLLEDVKEDKEVDPQEEYKMLRVKRSQLIFTYNETMNKMKQMIESMEKAEEEINKLDKEDETYKDDYMERYLSARDEAGLGGEESPDNFMKYLPRLESFRELINKVEE